MFILCDPKGDILVSIQGKNVIGIRRIAIERILKQYKVDQEIEIVVCRLKDPKFILNLTKANQNPLSNQANINNNNNNNSNSNSSNNNSKRVSNDSVQNNLNINNIVNVDSAKYRSINEQIFNELILFQDPSYIEEQQQHQQQQQQHQKPPRASRASTSTNSSNQSINQQQKMFKTQTSSSQVSQNLNEFRQYYHETSSSQISNTFTSSKQAKILSKLQQQRQYEQSIPIGFDENLISIQLNNSDEPNTRSGSGSISSSSSSVMVEQPIQITPNPDNHKFVTLRPTPPKNAPPPSSNLRRLSKPNNTNANNNINTNTNSVWSDSGYADSMRKSDNKSSYYSDISITVYDNIVGSNSAHTNTGTHMINSINSNNKTSVESPSSHVAVTIGGPQTHALHPQMQPMNIDQFNNQYVPNQLLPIQYTQTKSMSVNDFTGR